MLFFNVINPVQLLLLCLDYLYCCDISGFRGSGLFCLDNKITRIGSVFVFCHDASYTFSILPRRDVMR